MCYKKNIFVLIVALLLFVCAKADHYYVAANGSDQKGDGSKNKPWQSLSFACGRVLPDRGHTIFVAAGKYYLDSLVTLPSGTSLLGAGQDKTIFCCRYLFDMEAAEIPAGKCKSYQQDKTYNISPRQGAALQLNGNHQRVSGFTMDGDHKKCMVGIFILYGRDLQFEHLSFRHFKIGGWWMQEGYQVTLRYSTFADNSWGNKNQSYGAVMFHRTDSLYIYNNEIVERGTGSYGIKMAGMNQSCMWTFRDAWTTKSLNNNIQIYNNRIDVDETGNWQAPGGGYAPSITIEFNSNIEGNHVNIHHNWLNNHISIVSWETGQATGYHIHHNYFDFRKPDTVGLSRYAYFVEANEAHFEIDHNIVLGGYYPIASWQDNKINPDHLIHHNVFYAPVGGRHFFFRDASGHDGYRFYNNTVIDTGGVKGIFDINGKSGQCNRNTDIRNNIFISTQAPRGDILGDSCSVNGLVANNLFYHISPRGTNAITGNPLLSIANLRFILGSKSPAINTGQVIPGITDNAVGQPDLGAFEYGAALWSAGPPEKSHPVANAGSIKDRHLNRLALHRQ